MISQHVQEFPWYFGKESAAAVAWYLLFRMHKFSGVTEEQSYSAESNHCQSSMSNDIYTVAGMHTDN